MASEHMTWCELFVVYAVLHTYRAVLRDCCALFMLDNEPDVHVLNRQRTRSRRLAGLLREIYTIAVEQNISIFAKHRRRTAHAAALHCCAYGRGAHFSALAIEARPRVAAATRGVRTNCADTAP